MLYGVALYINLSNFKYLINLSARHYNKKRKRKERSDN